MHIKWVRFHKLSFGNFNMNQEKSLNILKLFFCHAEIVSQFVHKRLADLLADLRLARTDRFDILPIKHDVGRTHRNIKDALIRRWHAVKDA